MATQRHYRRALHFGTPPFPFFYYRLFSPSSAAGKGAQLAAQAAVPFARRTFFWLSGRRILQRPFVFLFPGVAFRSVSGDGFTQTSPPYRKTVRCPKREQLGETATLVPVSSKRKVCASNVQLASPGRAVQLRSPGMCVATTAILVSCHSRNPFFSSSSFRTPLRRHSLRFSSYCNYF